MHVKGLELPGYDPRKLQTLALGLAVAARGACHNRTSAYEVDLSDRLDAEATPGIAPAPPPPRRPRGPARLVDPLQVPAHALRDVPEESATLHRAVTGLATTADDLCAGRRAHRRRQKAVQPAQGWTRAVDTLPPRLLARPERRLRTVHRPDWLTRQIDAYYAVRGWDGEGRPGSQLTWAQSIR